MRLSVIAAASNRIEARYLVESADKHKVPLTVYDKGGNDLPMEEWIRRVRIQPAEYVLSTDAYDVLVSRWDEDEVISLIDAEPSGIINSCEADCWPGGPWAAAYKPETPWWACNGGQFCGRREAIVAMLEENARQVNTAGGGNQERLHRMVAAGYPIGLDQKCRIFQSMAGVASKYIGSLDGNLFNSFTGTYPMFAHFNGRTMGIEIWRDLLAQD
mgnify:CR=1 FL=1